MGATCDQKTSIMRTPSGSTPGGLISGLDRYFSAALYDRTAKRLVKLPQGFYELETLSFSPSGRKAVARRGSKAVLFDFETRRERVLFPCEVAARWYWPPGRTVSWSPDESYLAWGRLVGR